MARNGKIARLPRKIRERLNRRLEDGESGKKLVEWLNSLSEVRLVLECEFGDVPVSEQNLSQWRQGGYLEWKRHQEALGRAETLAEQGRDHLKATGGLPLSDSLAPSFALLLAARLEAALSEEPEKGKTDSPALKPVLQLSRELAQLRRDDHRATRLRLDVEDEKRERKKKRKQKRERKALRKENQIYHDLRKLWVKEQLIKPFTDNMLPEGVNYVREKMGLAPLPPEDADDSSKTDEAGPGETEAITPNQSKSQ